MLFIFNIQVLEEIRRQEEWEMNASIREAARNRNTQQTANVFHTPRSQVNGGRPREERMAGLMGGGGGMASSPPTQNQTPRDQQLDRSQGHTRQNGGKKSVYYL